MTKIKKEDVYINLFMGTSYQLQDPQTVGELRSQLEQIIQDLPHDNKAKISEVYLKDNKLVYTLKDGIIE
ncbi:hypothetical protein HOA92_06530 [archaeon]|jgi:hypothetical protein|nr:hypothetical protein [archaeon]MBT6762667.1 hypothetical protein [archaeon]